MALPVGGPMHAEHSLSPCGHPCKETSAGQSPETLPKDYIPTKPSITLYRKRNHDLLPYTAE